MPASWQYQWGTEQLRNLRFAFRASLLNRHSICIIRHHWNLSTVGLLLACWVGAPVCACVRGYAGRLSHLRCLTCTEELKPSLVGSMKTVWRSRNCRFSIFHGSTFCLLMYCYISRSLMMSVRFEELQTETVWLFLEISHFYSVVFDKVSMLNVDHSRNISCHNH